MKKLACLVFAVLAASVSQSYAEVGHGAGNHAHEQKTANKTVHGGHGHSGDGAHHRHGQWIDPPKAYAGKVSEVWADADAIERGEEIYQRQCLSCHGSDGQGTGPIARVLSHPPADLTNNFHTSPGAGDAYLFWRVSEGGNVEPFKSQGSKMPAFKTILSVGERWDVLAYVHTFFHQGLMKWQHSKATGAGSENAGSDS